MYYQKNIKIGITEIIIGINIFAFVIIYYFTPKLFYVFSLNIGNSADFLIKHNRVIEYTINQNAFWQLLTSMFLHGSPLHLIFNMYGLLMFGKPIEERWGKINFLSFYLTVGILANIASVLFLNLTPNELVSLVGASGAIMGVILAFGAYYPEVRLLLFFVIPIKVKWAILLYAALELYFEISNKLRQSSGTIAHFTHLFGFIFGFLYLLIFFKINAIKEMFFRKNTNYY